MDHQIFDMQKYGGISRYFSNIDQYLKEDTTYENQISILKTNNYYLRDRVFSKNPFIKYKLRRQKKQLRYNRKYSIKKIQANDFDVFHPTYYDPYFLENLRKPFVLTIHDMIHERFPEYFAPYDEFARFKRLTINKADHFIAISETTKHDLQYYYEIPDEKISVIYHGVEISEKNHQARLGEVNFPYILFIGDRFGYKNFFNFIRAFKSLSQANKDIKIICTGSSFNPVELEFLLRSGISKNIVQLSVTDQELDSLYQHALFYINPSLLEGFGFPILEAFRNECLTLLSDTSCFHEIAGNAAMYFNPLSVDDIGQCMLNALSDPIKKQDFQTRGINQLMKFPLEKSMIETKEVYKLVLNKAKFATSMLP